MSEENDIVAAKEAITEAWIRRPGVTGIDVGLKYVRGEQTSEVAIRLWVRKKLVNVLPEDRFPNLIGSHKTDVIEREFKPIGIPDTAAYSPMLGGVQITNDVGNTATAGMFVTDNSTGQLLILATFHGSTTANGAICQPDNGAPKKVGHLLRDGHGLVPPIDADLYLYAAPRGIDQSIADLGPISNIHEASSADIGKKFRKRGRTTGVTSGIFEGIKGTINSFVFENIGGKVSDALPIVYYNVMSFKADGTKGTTMAAPGDSGSMVLDGWNRAVGMIFGADDTTACAIPIQEIMSKLDVTPCISGTIIPHAITITYSESLVVTGGSSEWGKIKIGSAHLKACPKSETKTYTYTLRNVFNNLEINASTMGFDEPVFSWTVNAEKLNDFNATTFAETDIRATVEYYNNPTHPELPTPKLDEPVKLAANAFHEASYTASGTFGRLRLIPTKVQGHIHLDVQVEVRDKNDTSLGNVFTQTLSCKLRTQIFSLDQQYHIDRAKCEKSWHPLPHKSEYTFIDAMRSRPRPFPMPTFQSGINFLVRLDGELEELSKENPNLAHELSGDFEQRLNLPSGFFGTRRRIVGQSVST